jgi:MioC protein
MAHFDIIIGSTLGGAEYVAEHLAEQLQSQHHQTALHYKANFDAINANQTAETVWLVVTSTHGAGQVPDNLQPFTDQLAKQSPQKTALRYAVVALGDRNYDTFCAAGQLLDQLLEQFGAQKIGERLEIDVTAHDIPEDAADEWFSSWHTLIH